MTLLIATGLLREARIISAPGIVAIAGGGDGARLERDLEQAIRAQPVRALLSSGLAGALDPSLQIGDVIVGTEGDPRLVATLQRALPTAIVGMIVGCDEPVATIEAKRALRINPPLQGEGDRRRRWRGVPPDGDTPPSVPPGLPPPPAGEDLRVSAVDMESHVAARVAEHHGLPYATLRVISDRASESLPPAALCGMRPDGTMAMGPVLASLLRQPAQLPALVRTGWNAERAFRALLRCYRMIGLVDLVEHALDVA